MAAPRATTSPPRRDPFRALFGVHRGDRAAAAAAIAKRKADRAALRKFRVNMISGSPSLTLADVPGRNDVAARAMNLAVAQSVTGEGIPAGTVIRTFAFSEKAPGHGGNRPRAAAVATTHDGHPAGVFNIIILDTSVTLSRTDHEVTIADDTFSMNEPRMRAGAHTLSTLNVAGECLTLEQWEGGDMVTTNANLSAGNLQCHIHAVYNSMSLGAPVCVTAVTYVTDITMYMSGPDAMILDTYHKLSPLVGTEKATLSFYAPAPDGNGWGNTRHVREGILKGVTPRGASSLNYGDTLELVMAVTG